MEVTGSTAEKFRDLCALTIILVVAASVRFYSLDQNSLSATELSNFLACDVRGWFAMVSYYVGNSGMPPGYPTLLCQFTDWTGSADFFVRALSALAGTISVYIAYLIGKHFFSSMNGLLAAAIVATDFQMLLIDRTATVYSVLTLSLTLSSYFFCRLLVERETAIGRNVAVNITGERWGLQWNWKPSFACDARFLLGFWLSSALAFYISPIALMLLAVELMASFFLVESSSRRVILRTLWLPILIVMLPWMPKFYGLSKWALDGNLFGMRSSVNISRNLQNLLPIDPSILNMQIVLAIAVVVLLVTRAARKKYRQDQARFLLLIIFQLVTATTAFLLIHASDPQSYTYFRWLLVILLAEPLAMLITLCPFHALKNSLLFLFVIGIMLFQTNSNASSRLYTRGGEVRFNLAAEIIRNDQPFMEGNRTIFTSTTLFEHYLESYDVILKNSMVLEKEKLPKIGSFLGGENFYYLEYAGDDKDFLKDYPVFIALSQQYQVLCMTQIPRIRITKFAIDHASDGNQDIDCRSHLSGQRVLR